MFVVAVEVHAHKSQITNSSTQIHKTLGHKSGTRLPYLMTSLPFPDWHVHTQNFIVCCTTHMSHTARKLAASPKP